MRTRSDFAAAFTVPAAAAAPAPRLGKRTHYLVRKLHLRLDRLIVEDYTGLEVLREDLRPPHRPDVLQRDRLRASSCRPRS